MLNKKGFSLLGMLISVTIMMLLTIWVLKQYQTISAAQQTQMQQALQQFQPPAGKGARAGQTGQQNTLRNFRTSVQEIEKAAARRSQEQENMYK